MPSAAKGAGSSLVGVAVQRRCPRSGQWLAGRVVAAADALDEDGEEVYLARFADGSKEHIPSSEVKLWSVSSRKRDSLHPAGESAGVGEGPVPLPTKESYTEGGRDTTLSAPAPRPKHDTSGPAPLLNKKMPVKVSGPTPKLKSEARAYTSRLQRHRSWGKRKQVCVCNWNCIIRWPCRCCALLCVPIFWTFQLARLATSYMAKAFALGWSPTWRCQTDPGYAWMYWPGYSNWYWPGSTYWQEPRWTYWQEPQPEVFFQYEARPTWRGWNSPSSAFLRTQSTEFFYGLVSGLRFFRGPCMIIACLYVLFTIKENMLSVSSSNTLSSPLQFSLLDTRQLQTDIFFAGDGLLQVSGEWFNLFLIGLLKLLLLVIAGVGISIIFLRLWQLGQFCMVQCCHRLPDMAEHAVEDFSTSATPSHSTGAAALYSAQSEAVPEVLVQPAVSVPLAVHAPVMQSSASDSSRHHLRHVTLQGECALGEQTTNAIHSGDAHAVTTSIGEARAFFQAVGMHQGAASPESRASTATRIPEPHLASADAGSASPVLCTPPVFESEQENLQESWSLLAACIVMFSVLTCILLAYLNQSQHNLMSSFSTGGMLILNSIGDGVAVVGLTLLEVPAWILKLLYQICYPAAKLLAIGVLCYSAWFLAVPAMSCTVTFVSDILDQWKNADSNGEQPLYHETPFAGSSLSQLAPPPKSHCSPPVAANSHSASSMCSIFAILITTTGMLVVVTAGAANFVKKLLTSMPAWFGDYDVQDSFADSWTQNHNGLWLEQITGLLDMVTYALLGAFQILCRLPSLMGGLLWDCLVAPVQSLLTAEVVLVWLPGICLALIVIAFVDWLFGSWERWSHEPQCHLGHCDTGQYQGANLVQSAPGYEAVPFANEGQIAGDPDMPAVFGDVPVASASAAGANFSEDDLSHRFLHSDSPVHVSASQAELHCEQSSSNAQASQVRSHQAPPLCAGSHYLAVLPGFHRFSVVMLMSEGTTPGTVIVLPCRRTFRRTFCQAPRQDALEVPAIDLHLGPFKMIAGQAPAFVRERLQQLPPGRCRPPPQVVTAGTSELSRRRLSARLEKLASLILPGRRFKYPFELKWVKGMGFRDSQAAAESNSTAVPGAEDTQRGSLRGLLTRHSGDLWGSVDEILRNQTQQASRSSIAGTKTVAARGGA